MLIESDAANQNSLGHTIGKITDTVRFAVQTPSSLDVPSVDLAVANSLSTSAVIPIPIASSSSANFNTDLRLTYGWRIRLGY